MKKKVLLSLFMLLLFSMTLFVTACQDEGPSDNDDETEITLTLDVTELVLDRFEERVINATVTGTTDAIVWSSSDESVVVVINGKVDPRGEGTATITAKVKNVEKTCTVEVIDSGAVPTININTPSGVTLVEGQTYQLDFEVKYKNNQITAPLTITSGNTDVVTVDNNGLVTAKEYDGDNSTVTVTLSGSYKGYQLTQKSVTFTVVEDIEMNFNRQSVELSATAIGTEHVNTATVQYTIKVRGEEVTGACVSVEYSEDNIAVYNPTTYLLTAIAKGYTRVTVTYTSEKGSTVSGYFDVDVYAPTVMKKSYDFNLDLSESQIKTTLNSEIEPSNILSVINTSDQENVLSEVSGDELIFDKDKLSAGEYIFVIEGKTLTYRVNVIVATKIIKNANEFKDFMDMVATRGNATTENYESICEGEYYLLGNDIDVSGKTYTYWEKSPRFSGTFNGNNKVISNMNMPRFGFMRITNGTIKNVSFVNAQYAAGNNAGFVANEVHSGGSVENVFVMGSVTVSHTGTFAGLVNYVQSGAQVINSVAIVDLSNVTNAKLGSYVVTSRGLVQNCIGVSYDVVGYSDGVNGTFINNHTFDTVADARSAIAQDATIISGLDTSIWNTSVNFPVPHSFVAWLEVEFLNAVSEMPSGADLVLSATSDPFTVYRLREQYSDITIEDGVLKVGLNAPKTTIEVIAESIFDSTKNDVLQIEITKPLVNCEQAGSVGDFVRSAGIGSVNELSIAKINEVTGEQLTEADIVKVMLDNKPVNATIDNGKIFIPKDLIQQSLKGINYLDVETDDYIYRFKVTIVAAALSNSTEMLQFFTAYAGTSNTAQYAGEIVILTNNIDCTDYEHPLEPNNNARFSGTFDGRGYSISNLTFSKADNRGLFRYLNTDGVIENLALINVTYSSASYGGIIGVSINGTIRNCFIQGVYTTKNNATYGASGLMAIPGATAKLTNCIVLVNVTSEGQDERKAIASAYCNASTQIKDCYFVSNLTRIANKTDNSELTVTNCARFANAEELKSNLTDLSGADGWSSLWRITSDALYFGLNAVITWNS